MYLKYFSDDEKRAFFALVANAILNEKKDEEIEFSDDEKAKINEAYKEFDEKTCEYYPISLQEAENYLRDFYGESIFDGLNKNKNSFILAAEVFERGLEYEAYRVLDYCGLSSYSFRYDELYSLVNSECKNILNRYKSNDYFQREYDSIDYKYFYRFIIDKNERKIENAKENHPRLLECIKTYVALGVKEKDPFYNINYIYEFQDYFKARLGDELYVKVLQKYDFAKYEQILDYFIELGIMSESEKKIKKLANNNHQNLFNSCYASSFNCNAEFARIFGFSINESEMVFEGVRNFAHFKEIAKFFKELYLSANICQIDKEFQNLYNLPSDLKFVKNKKLFYFEVKNYFENIPYECSCKDDVLDQLGYFLRLGVDDLKHIDNSVAKLAIAKENTQKAQKEEDLQKEQLLLALQAATPKKSNDDYEINFDEE